MSVLRAYYPPSLPPAGDEIILERAESHHLVKVRRAKAGDEVAVLDGAGNVWECSLEDANPRAVRLKIRAHKKISAPECAITLAFALPAGGIADLIAQKATELGAAKIAPLFTARCEVHLTGERAARKAEKWQSIAIESCKQCGNPFLPEISPAQPLEDFLETVQPDALKLIAALTPDATSLRKTIEEYLQRHHKMPAEAVWLIGPEGDFSPEEYTLAASAGFKPITLGPLVLRSETAAIVALGLLNNELNCEGNC